MPTVKRQARGCHFPPESALSGQPACLHDPRLPALSMLRMGRRHIHPNDTGTVPLEQAQAIVDYVWRTAGLAHPPKMRPLAPTARTLHATATRQWIRIPKAGIKSTVLLHEIAHSMTSDAFGEHCHHHGPRFVGVFMRLLCAHIPTFSIDGLMVAARQERVEFNFEGPIHLADPSR